MGQDNNLQRELIEEENAKLLFYLERHQRWAKLCDEDTLARHHRILADMLKDVINDNETMIDWLKAT